MSKAKIILILGSSGQVGRALVALAPSESPAIGLSRQQFNLETCDRSKVAQILDLYQPKAVINAAAYTAVDLAETHESLAMKTNAESPGIIAKECASRKIPFVHYSTDYVFSGEGQRPWIEEDQVSPLSAYGRSKLEGEKQILSAGGSFLIFRTSWVYDRTGKNFLNTMLRLGSEKESLTIVADQWGAPTYAPHLAKATWEALNQALSMSSFPSGIYHLCNQGETSWHGFAVQIFEEARKKNIPLKVKEVHPIPTSSYPTPARRPLNSRLNCDKAKKILGVQLPKWELGLKTALEQ